jgi:hypothetical protein
MGKGQTPARVRAVLLPPRPAPRAEPVAEDRTQLRSRDDRGAAVGALDPLPGEMGGQSLVAAAMAPALDASSLAPEDVLPPVAPKPLDPLPFQQPVPQQSVSQQSVPRHLLDCRVSVIPRLPVVNLEKPNSNWPDLTPSPVPRVSLIPPTGRLEPSQLRSATEARGLPTVAPRTRAMAPALTLPRLGKPANGGWLSRRIARDLRSSKREIAFGLGIGIGLSFVLGKLGQTYLESRSAMRAGALGSWTASALPSPEPRPLAKVVPSTVPLPNAVVPNAGASAPPVTPTLAAAAAAAPAAAVAAALTASAQSVVATQLSAVPLRSEARAARPSLSKSRSTKAARRQASASRPSDTESGGADATPADELDPPGKTPLSPSESAGLGRELPL